MVVVLLMREERWNRLNPPTARKTGIQATKLRMMKMSSVPDRFCDALDGSAEIEGTYPVGAFGFYCAAPKHHDEVIGRGYIDVEEETEKVRIVVVPDTVVYPWTMMV